MKLTKDDVIYLKYIGETDEENIKQIERATSKTVYHVFDSTGQKQRIGVKKAIELLGRENFLSGIARSAFHFTAYQKSNDGAYGVMFNSSALFKRC